MSTTSSTMFTGSSRYAADFQQVIERAVSIASLPITQLNSQKTVLGQQQAALISLSSKISAFGTAVQSLNNALGSASYVINNSSSSIAAANVATGALEGSYTVNILDAGSYTRAMSADGLLSVSDPSKQAIADAATYTLTVNGVNTTVTPATADLSGLVAAINQANAGVQATVINIGSPTAPDYRLSLQSTALDNVSVQVTANLNGGGTQDLLSTLSAGAPAKYQVNGQPPSGIVSTSRTVTLAPGVTATLQQTGSTTIDVSRNTTALSSAINSFVTAYNASVDELDLHRGQNSGALKGDSSIWMISSSLRNIANFSQSGDVSSMAQLGLSFTNTGKLTFDSSALASTSIEDLQSFFGDGTTPGFLLNAQNILNSIDGPSGGSLQSEIDSIGSQMDHTDALIQQNQQRVDSLEQSLNARMAAADALVAGLEQQASYFTNLFESMKANSQSNN